jgi:hypothetical protein
LLQIISTEVKMRVFMGKYLTIGFVVVCLLLVFPVTVSAIGVSGAKYMGSIAPGGTDTQMITVSVGTDEKASDIVIDIQGFGQKADQTYFILPLEEDISPYSARSFITVDNSTIHLEPGETKKVTATITLPKNVGSGGRYAIIYVHALPGKGQFTTTAINVPVLITVTGTTPTETGSITGLSVGTVMPGQPVTVTTSLKNTGDYHYYHTVNSVIITDAAGNTVGNFTTQPSVYAIIPGNTISYTATPNLQNIPVGTYTVNSKVLLESGTVLDEKTTSFAVKTDYIAPVTESNITLTPGKAGTLKSPDGRYSVLFPQGAVLGDVVVTLKPVAMDKLPGAPADAKLGTTCFEITGLSGLLGKDATVTVTYSADDLTAAGGDASRLKLAYFDAAQNAWVVLPTQAETGSTKLTANTNHMGIFTVMVASAGTGTAAGDSGESALPLPPVLSMIAIAAAAIMAGKTVRRRK